MGPLASTTRLHLLEATLNRIHTQSALGRRNFLRGTLAAAVLIPTASVLAGCAGGGTTPGGTASGAVTAGNPFGVASGSTVDAVIFKGGYDVKYVEFAAEILAKGEAKATAKVSPSTDITGELQPRFAGGTPPDLIDNSGAKKIGMTTIVDQLEDLQGVVDAKNLEGKVIKDTLYPGVLTPGTYGGKLASINYVLTVFAVWYSASLFKELGLTPPKTWDEMLKLGEDAKAQGKYLFTWGTEAATYYQEFALASAIKEGGDDVRLAIENLKPDAWSHPAIQDVFTALETCVKNGYFKPGGSGTKFTAAQASWSNAQEALLYPSGSWIENEMKDQTKAGFEMTGMPVPHKSSSPKLGADAIHSASDEPFVVPSAAKNPAGGKELLRTMLSQEAAANFAKTILAPTIVKGTVPADGFGSTALVSQTKMLDAAADNVFDIRFGNVYGLNKDQLVTWNSFLDGKIDAAGLTADLQKISDKVANDKSITKIEIK